LGHFLFSSRDHRQDNVHVDDILAEDLGAESVGRLETWEALRTACNKEVAHLTWERVRRRARETEELTKWAKSDDVGALLLQLVYVVTVIRDRLGSEYRTVARDGTDFVQELLDGYERIQAWEHEGLLGIASGSGAYPIGPSLDDPT